MSSFPAQSADSAQPIDKKKLLLSIGAVVVSVGVLLFVVLRISLFGAADPSDVSRTRVAIDAETGEIIEALAIEDESIYPWKNPKTGKASLYPPELCYWTKDGKAKTEPTYVLLGSLVGKPGKTKCPDCGRDVVAHNPKPPMDLMIEAYKAREQAGKR